jgi:hypothetical protein
MECYQIDKCYPWIFLRPFQPGQKIPPFIWIFREELLVLRCRNSLLVIVALRNTLSNWEMMRYFQSAIYAQLH